MAGRGLIGGPRLCRIHVRRVPDSSRATRGMANPASTNSVDYNPIVHPWPTHHGQTVKKHDAWRSCLDADRLPSALPAEVVRLYLATTTPKVKRTMAFSFPVFTKNCIYIPAALALHVITCLFKLSSRTSPRSHGARFLPPMPAGHSRPSWPCPPRRGPGSCALGCSLARAATPVWDPRPAQTRRRASGGWRLARAVTPVPETQTRRHVAGGCRFATTPLRTEESPLIATSSNDGHGLQADMQGVGTRTKRCCSSCRVNDIKHYYCTRKCQKEDWLQHREICGVPIVLTE